MSNPTPELDMTREELIAAYDNLLAAYLCIAKSGVPDFSIQRKDEYTSTRTAEPNPPPKARPTHEPKPPRVDLFTGERTGDWGLAIPDGAAHSSPARNGPVPTLESLTGFEEYWADNEALIGGGTRNLQWLAHLKEAARIPWHDQQARIVSLEAERFEYIKALGTRQ